MRKTICFIILIFTFSQILNAQIQDVVTFSYDKLTFDTIGEYIRVTMFECNTIDSIGHPELPRFEIKYIIPKGMLSGHTRPFQHPWREGAVRRP